MRPTISKASEVDRRAALAFFILRWLILAVLIGLVVGVVLRLV
jgi:hypothetical protein